MAGLPEDKLKIVKEYRLNSSNRIKIVDNRVSTYKQVVNQNISFPNRDTFFTYDDVFGFVSKVLTNQTEYYMNKKLRGVEFPDRDAAAKDINAGGTLDQLAKNVVPRAVIMGDINATTEELGFATASNSNYWKQSGLQIELEAIKTTQFPTDEVRNFRYFRDTNISLSGGMNFTSVIIFYTVILEKVVESVELMKQFKREYILNREYPLDNITLLTQKVVDTTPDGKVSTPGFSDEYIGKAVSGAESIPYAMKVLIPDEVILALKQSLHIDKLENSDDVLMDVFTMYSYSGIGREINGATRQVSWFTRYKGPVVLTPLSIERSDVTRGETSTSAVRLEFKLDYMDINGFKLRSKYNILSDENIANICKHDIPAGLHNDGIPDITVGGNSISSYVAQNTLNIPYRIGNKVEYYSNSLEYVEADIKWNEATNTSHAELSLLEFFSSTSGDGDFSKYLKYIAGNPRLIDEEAYSVILKHGSSQTVDVDINSSEGTHYIYDDFSIYDEYGEAGKMLNVLVYVDMKRFTDWKRSVGILPTENLSGEYLKK